jgi:hypothetical protein
VTWRYKNARAWTSPDERFDDKYFLRCFLIIPLVSKIRSAGGHFSGAFFLSGSKICQFYYTVATRHVFNLP